jgi:hypothetical protein
MQRIRETLLTCVAVLLVSACVRRPEVIGPEQWEIVLRLPNTLVWHVTTSPDGTIYATTSRELYRADAGDYRSWTHIPGAPEKFVDLSSPSRDVVYGLSHGIGRCNLFRWTATSGWQDADPDRRLVRFPQDLFGCVALNDVLALPNGEVYVAGDKGILMLLKNDHWRSEQHPLVTDPDSTAPAGYGSDLMTIGGDSDRIIAAGAPLLEKVAGAWRTVPRHPRLNAGITAIAAQRGRMLIGSRDYAGALGRAPGVWLFENNQWTLLGQESWGFPDGIHGGGLQRDSSALFYSWRDVVVIKDKDARVYHFPATFNLSDAMVLGDYLYVAGRFANDGIIARIPR